MKKYIRQKIKTKFLIHFKQLVKLFSFLSLIQNSIQLSLECFEGKVFQNVFSSVQTELSGQLVVLMNFGHFFSPVRDSRSTMISRPFIYHRLQGTSTVTGDHRSFAVHCFQRNNAKVFILRCVQNAMTIAQQFDLACIARRAKKSNIFSDLKFDGQSLKFLKVFNIFTNSLIVTAGDYE